MYKLRTVTTQQLIQHCDNCDKSYLDKDPEDNWSGVTGRFGMVEAGYNLHFHFCSRDCEDAFKDAHEKG